MNRKLIVTNKLLTFSKMLYPWIPQKHKIFTWIFLKLKIRNFSHLRKYNFMDLKKRRKYFLECYAVMTLWHNHKIEK